MKLQGLNFTAKMKDLCIDIAQHVDDLNHIDMRRVAVGFIQTRKDVSRGLYASLTPLRFENGELSQKIGGKTVTIQRLFDSKGTEMLYIVNFYMPRFLKRTFRQRLITVVHELLHISPQFNGDIRRFAGRNFAHGNSERSFDAKAERLLKAWLQTMPKADLYEFLQFSFDELVEQYGGLYGTKYSEPRIYNINNV